MIRILLLLAIAFPAFGVATTTTLNCQNGGSQVVNIPHNFATNATENIVIVQVTPLHPVTIEFNNTAAWYYRTTLGVATDDKPVAAGVPLKIRFTATSTFYTLRQSADGVMNALPLLLE